MLGGICLGTRGGGGFGCYKGEGIRCTVAVVIPVVVVIE